jgi:curved DNA-binding protein CbpA
MNYDFGNQAAQRKRTDHCDQPDPYELLGVERDSELAFIRQRFRTLTRVHHPDRNRRNPDYDPGYYASICKAYETLSDPRKRAAFDQGSAATFSSLKQSASVITQDAFNAKATMSDGDLRQFNDLFEKQRKADPNDRGYGDQMSGRMTQQEIASGRRPIEAPTNLFGGNKVSGDAFNSRFQQELRSKRQARTNNIMERGVGEPEGWFGGNGGFSDISMFDGDIVNAEQDDFSRTEGGGQLYYADYMSGFDTITEQLPEEHHYMTPVDTKKAYGERLSQLSQMPERGHSLSFAQSEALLHQQREQALAREAEKNRQVVLKYREQYASQDLLPGGTSTRGTNQNMNQSLSDRMFFRN